MPTTLAGLLIFLVLLAPGLAYSTFRASSRPVIKPTTLQELSGIALRSALFNGLALALFAVVRVWLPHATPDVGFLVRDPNGFVQEHYAQLALWGTGLLAVACALAIVSARAADDTWLSRLLNRVGFNPRGRSRQEPAWWVLFENPPEGSIVHAGCTLEDGTYFGGWVNSYSPDSDETADREMTLSAPIQFRAPGADSEVEELPISAVSISARRLSYLTVTYVEQDPDQPDEAGEDQTDAQPEQ